MSNNFLNNSKFMDRFFRRVDGVVWDLMSGKIGVKTSEGIITLEGAGDDAQIVINPFDQFGMEVPAFAQNTPAASVVPGDVIYGTNKVLGWVLDAKAKSFTLMTPSGTRSNWTPPKIAMFGFDSGIMVLRSLVSMLPSGNNGLSSMQSMLMPMMMMGGGNLDMESIMPMMLFSQIQQPAADPNNPAAVVANQGNMANMMQMMMFANMMGGKKSGGNTGGRNFFDKD